MRLRKRKKEDGCNLSCAEDGLLEVKFIDCYIGSGVFAKDDIAKGRLLTHYDGEMITNEEGEKRHARYSNKDGSFLFFFSHKGKKLCIDATYWSGIGRMINDNHRKPNSKVIVEDKDGESPVLSIYSMRQILTGEEICFDYNDGSAPWRKFAGVVQSAGQNFKGTAASQATVPNVEEDTGIQQENITQSGSENVSDTTVEVVTGIQQENMTQSGSENDIDTTVEVVTGIQRENITQSDSENDIDTTVEVVTGIQQENITQSGSENDINTTVEEVTGIQRENISQSDSENDIDTIVEEVTGIQQENITQSGSENDIDTTVEAVTGIQQKNITQNGSENVSNTTVEVVTGIQPENITQSASENDIDTTVEVVTGIQPENMTQSGSENVSDTTVEVVTGIQWENITRSGSENDIDTTVEVVTGIQRENITRSGSENDIDTTVEVVTGIQQENITPSGSENDIDTTVEEVTGIHRENITQSGSENDIDTTVEEVTGIHRENITQSGSENDIDTTVEEVTGIHREYITQSGSENDIDTTVEVVTGLQQENMTQSGSGNDIDITMEEVTGIQRENITPVEEDESDESYEIPGLQFSMSGQNKSGDDESEYPDDYNGDNTDIDDSDNDPNFDPEEYASGSDNGNAYEFNSDSDSPLKSFSATATTSNTDPDDDMSVNPSSSVHYCDLEGYVSDSDHSDVIPNTAVPDLSIHLNKSDGGNRCKPKFGVCRKKEKKDGCKQVYDKTHFCTFCGVEIKSKISRHLLKVHKNNSEISRICMLPKRSKERMIRLEILENEGNFRHNIEVLHKQCGVLVVARREAGENHDVTEYLPCEYCKKFMLKRSLWNHHRKCPVMYYYKTSDYTAVDEGTESSNNAVRRGRNLLYSSLMNDPDQYLTTLLSRMHDDHLKKIVIKDKLIKRYTALRVESLGNKSDQKINDIHRVSQGARTLARLVFAAQEKYPDCIISLKSLLRPENFDKVVSVTKELTLKEHNSPTSLGRYIGNLLGHAIQIKIGETLRANNLEECQEGKHFQKLYVAEWNYRVNSACTRRLNTIQRKKVKTIPLTEDLLKLHKFTSDKIALMSKMLKQSKNAVHWKELAHLTMCRLIMFNKRRRAEVKDLKVEDYISRPKWQDNQNGEFDMALSTSSRMLAKRMDMVIAAGKSRKNVDAYVLLPPDAKAAVDILLKYREEVGIPKTNPYIFARPNSDTPYSGNTELKKLADSCPGLEHPERITSNHLRKYIATVSQILDMTDNEIEMLATHLGHDPKTHKENYRLAHSTRELAQVSQLLLLVEEGDVNKWKGRKLSEIPVEDLPLEVPEAPEDTEDEGEEDSVDKDLADYRQDDDKETEEMDSETIASHTKQRKTKHGDSDTDSEFNNSDKESETTEIRTNQRKRKYDECDTSTEETVLNKKRKKRWSENENKIFKRLFSQFVMRKTMPPGSLLKKAEKELCRTVAQIRTRVHNIISGKQVL